MDALITRQSFGLLWLNPPYGDLSKDANGTIGYDGRGRARLEKLFYQKNTAISMRGEFFGNQAAKTYGMFLGALLEFGGGLKEAVQ